MILHKTIVLLGHGLRPVRGLGSLSIAGWFRGRSRGRKWNITRFIALVAVVRVVDLGGGVGLGLGKLPFPVSQEWMPSLCFLSISVAHLRSENLSRPLVAMSFSRALALFSVFMSILFAWGMKSLKPDNTERGLPYQSSFLERAVGKSLESRGFVERIGAIAVWTGSESGQDFSLLI